VETHQRKSQRRDRGAIVTDVRGALVRVLEGKAFKQVTVDELARESGLSRTAFYFYYKDKNQVLAAVLEELRDVALEQASAWWSGDAAPDVMIRETLRDIGSLWTSHGGVLRAAVEVSSYDAGFRTFYTGLMDDFIAATEDHLSRERDAGRLRPGVNPGGNAEALVWMGERCHYVGAVNGRPAEDTAELLI